MERLVTITTHDTSPSAHVVQRVLEEAGLDARLDGEATNWLLASALGDVKVLVPESQVERAMQVLRDFNSNEATDPERLTEEELERQAVAEAPEELLTSEKPKEPKEPLQPWHQRDKQSPPTEGSVRPPVNYQDPRYSNPDYDWSIDRDQYAWSAFSWAWWSWFCTPLGAFSAYYALGATFGSGPIKWASRIRLVAAVVILLTPYALLFYMRRGG